MGHKRNRHGKSVRIALLASLALAPLSPPQRPPPPPPLRYPATRHRSTARRHFAISGGRSEGNRPWRERTQRDGQGALSRLNIRSLIALASHVFSGADICISEDEGYSRRRTDVFAEVVGCRYSGREGLRRENPRGLISRGAVLPFLTRCTKTHLKNMCVGLENAWEYIA